MSFARELSQRLIDWVTDSRARQMQTAPYQPFQTLGCVPSCESLQHLAMSAGGYYYDLSSNSELTALERIQPATLHRVLVRVSRCCSELCVS